MIRFWANPECRRFALFLLIGAVNTGFGYAAFALFLWTGFGRDTAVVLGTIAGVIFNFRTIGSVFAARGLARLPHFVATYGVLLAANIALLRIVTATGVGAYLAEALVVLAIAPVSFFIMRRFVFGPAAEQTS
ncbi:GtrA family protein [Novosphingobium sp.]|uniref:GtrA family protein n=1 Tax=Novosphingobium sp. TaxID=1874826 RepID=UPI003D14931E